MQTSRNAVGRGAAALVVIVIIVVAGGAIYFGSSMLAPSSSTAIPPPSTTQTSTTSVQAPASITVDDVPAPVSVDPSASYDVPGGEILANVYQGLVFYNGSSGSQFVGVLAKDWTKSSNGLNYTFDLWPFEAFSDGTRLNASTVWFSFYRTMTVNLGISFYISEYLSVNGGKGFTGVTASGKAGIIELPWGIQQALASAGYSFSGSQTAQMQQAAGDLASILSHFSADNATIQKVMAYPEQAVVVSGPDQVKLNLDFPYSDFYQTISGSDGSVTSPVFIDANGGVQIDTANSYVNTHTMGSGPYVLQEAIGGSSVILKASPNYWAAQVPASQRDLMLSVPRIQTIVINYQSSEAVRLSDAKSGVVQVSQVDVNDLQQVENVSGVTVHIWGATPTIDFVAVDAYQYPYNITGVRLALEHAVNATQIQQDVYKGLAQSYVGPLDPVMAYYNKSISGFNYDTALSVSLLSQAGFSLTLPNGTRVNPSGRPFPALTLTYPSGSSTDEEEGTILQQQLAQVGITLNLNPESFVTIIESEANPASSSAYPAMQISGNTPVYIGPSDPAVYLTYCPVRCHHGDPAYLNDTAISQLVNEIIHTSNPTQLQQDYDQLTRLTNANAQYIWLDDTTAYTVTSSNLQGLWYNAALIGNWIFYASAY